MKKILIVDDSAFMRNTIKSMVTKNGYEVIGDAENGKIGVEKYKEFSPDIVTMDITMNEMSGLEALKEIIKYDPNAKVIMFSAMGQESMVLEAMTSGAKGFFIKPFKEDDIISAIAKLG